MINAGKRGGGDGGKIPEARTLLGGRNLSKM